MAKRRAKGEGTIYQRPDGLWVAQITLPGGKRIAKYSKNQKVVQTWLLTQRNAIREAMWVEDTSITVSQFLDRFLNDTLRHTIKPKTFDSYSSLIRLHINPIIGYIKLNDLRPYHLQDLYTQKIGSGLSKRTVQYIHAIIHRSLKQALKWNLVSRNVADLVDAPKPIKKTPKTLTVEQAKILLDYLKDDRLYGVYAVCLGCGLRMGEVLALHWEDINFDMGMLSVTRTIQYLPGQGLVINEPKTEKSRRQVAMPSFVEDALVKREKEGLAFKTSNGTPFSPRNIQRHFAKTLKNAGLPSINFHGLRHTYASIMLQQNIHPKTVQEALGHSTISLTLDTYSHVIPTLQKEAAEKMDEVMRI